MSAHREAVHAPPRPAHAWIWRLCPAVCILCTANAWAEDAAAGYSATPTAKRSERYATEANIPYYTNDDAITATEAASRARGCLLDLYYPKGDEGFATVIWFPGGGLTSLRRHTPTSMAGNDFAVVGAGYRLYGEVNAPVPIEDAAAAIAWTLTNIARYGGDPEKVFVAGHSAGGYLAAMVALDPRYLARHGRTPADLAGVVPVSGQMTTHFRFMREFGDAAPVRVDRYAPVFHANKDAPPFCLIVGDPAREWPARVEENLFFAATLRRLGAQTVEYHRLPGLDHRGVLTPGQALGRQFMDRVLRTRADPNAAPATPSAGDVAMALQEQRNTPGTVLIAHRGASALSPENTLQAGRAAARLGARAWEFDVDITLDGEIVLMHDETPNRTTDAGRLFGDRAHASVGTWTLADLRRLNATARFVRPVLADWLKLPPVEPEPVPTLAEAFKLAREEGLLLFPELKGGEPMRLAEAFADHVLASGLADQMIVISFHHEALSAVKRRVPTIRIMPLFRDHDVPADPVGYLRNLQACGMDVQERGVTETLVTQLHAAGMLLNVWTVNRPDALARLSRWGVDYATTDALFLAPAQLE